MKYIKSLFILPTCWLILNVLYGCGPGEKRGEFNAEAYTSAIENYRDAKDEFLVKNSGESPLPPEIRRNFSGLDYFPINLEYRILADFLPAAYPEKVSVPMNDGSEESYLRFGYASFQLNSQDHSLLVLKNMEHTGEPSLLFIPFYDETNGFETYGGGRYLEPMQIGEEKILLDFNKAYNPYCAYSPDYVCPLPPRENRLSAAIRAGEKTFEKTIE